MEYWQKQTKDKPLHENILWSKPESRSRAGKLLVIGGNSHAFLSVGEAYQAAEKAGIGVVHSLLPESLRKPIGNMLEGTDFAPSTPSGSFGRDALNEFLIQSAWADGVLLAGDLGRNSETSILLENYVQKYSGQLTITKDVVDYFYSQPELISGRPDTTLVLSLGQLQKLGTALKFQTPFLLGMGLMLLVQALHEFSQQHQLVIVTKELDSIVVAHRGRVSSTRLPGTSEDLWQVNTAASASVFRLQNPGQQYEAITTSLVA